MLDSPSRVGGNRAFPKTTSEIVLSHRIVKAEEIMSDQILHKYKY